MTSLAPSLLRRPLFGGSLGLGPRPEGAAPLREPAAAQANPAAMTAWLLDQLAFSEESSSAPGPLQTALNSSDPGSLQAALSQLSSSRRAQIQSQVSGAALEELIDLSHETDPQMYAEGLLRWARREEVSNHLAQAGLVYQFLSQGRGLEGVSTALRTRAQEALDAIQGRGALGNRLEFLGRNFAREASDPVMIAGMAAGSLVFSTARTAFLSRILATPGRSVLGARALASTGAFLLEVPTFWATTKGLREAIDPGHQAWDLRSNLRELAGLGLTLGSLKLSGALAGSLSRRLATTPNPSAWSFGERFGHGFLQQAGTLGGILAGHRLEEAAGLRAHVDGATTLVDSLATLLQFHVGGRISQEALGPRMQAYSQELEARSQLLEREALASERARLQAGIRNFFDGDGNGSLQAALATAGGRSEARPGDDGLAEARANISMMSTDPEGPRSEPLSSSRRLARQAEVRLPDRTGRSKDTLGWVVDRFEPEIAPAKMLRLLPEGVQAELLNYIGFSKNQISQVNEQHLGRGLGLALETRMRDVAAGLASSPDTAFENFPPQLSEAIRHADEIIGVIEYCRRSNQRSVLDTLWNSVSPDTQKSYESLKATVADVLGPHFRMAPNGGAKGSAVIQPQDAVLSIGSGDMMGLLALYRHQIRPGGHSWRTQLFVSARQGAVADEINQQGTYRGNTNLRDVQLNYAGDPRIVAVGPQGYEGVTKEMLQRSVRLQILNVPSNQLHEVLTEDYIKNLPENAILFEVIGGFIGKETRGPYQPGPGERHSILPYQLINQALEAHGRTDVQVVSGGGYIPGKALWRGYVQGRSLGETLPVEMVFAGPDGDTNISAAAELVAEAFAGRSLDNGFLRAASSHHQHSTELGKAMKNVTSLLAGYEAGRLAHQMYEGAMAVVNPNAEYNYSIREPLFALMEGLLLYNEIGINPIKARYRAEVRNDYWMCTDINMEEVKRVVYLARKSDVEAGMPRDTAMHQFLNDPSAQRAFLVEHVMNNPAIATTRNPKRGIAEAIIGMWQSLGSPYRSSELLPRKPDGKPAMTQEGVNSLPPLMAFYQFENHPIERRRMDTRLYDAARIFNPDLNVRVPPEVPDHIKNALEGVHPELNIAQLRRALEGKSEGGLGLMNRELRRLERYRSIAVKGNEEGAQRFQRQLEVVRAVQDGMLEGTPLRVTRSPILRPPYGNMFIVKMQEQDGRRDSFRAYLRVDGTGILDRVTQMGTLLRSFPEGSKLRVEVDVTGFSRRKAGHELAEIEYTIQQILTAFHLSRAADDVAIYVNRRHIQPDDQTRQDFSPEYFSGLVPLLKRLGRSRQDETLSANSIRNAGNYHAQVLNDFLQRSPGWPMILGYFAGPLNSAIKSAMTRPERSTFIGVYENGRMVDAFSVFRGYDNKPRALSHHLLSRLAGEFKSEPDYQDLAGADFFDGIELERFLTDFERYSDRIGRGKLEYRMIPLRSLPIEEALAGKVQGINPALLRLFLEQGDGNEARREMLRELAPFYERPMAEVRSQVQGIMARYLDPFHEQNRAFLETVPIFNFFEKNGPEAITQLTRNGEESLDEETH